MKYGIINKLYEKIYAFRCKGIIGFDTLSKLLLKISDPIIRSEVNFQKCYIHFSHQGVFYMHKYPNYDRNIGKICKFVKRKYERNLFVIDVGANVGDTILCIGDKDNYYYAFEGEERYYTLLRLNLKEYKYKLFKMFCGDTEENKAVEIDYKNGTGTLVSSTEGKSCAIRKIDNVLSDVRRPIDFIKIDTDGFDFAVIRGMGKLLKKQKPILYFEWTAPELIQNNEDLLGAFKQLTLIGYDRGIVFDKYGNLLCSINPCNLIMLKQLIDYSLRADIYYDVCLFHSSNSINMKDLLAYLRRND